MLGKRKPNRIKAKKRQQSFHGAILISHGHHKISNSSSPFLGINSINTSTLDLILEDHVAYLKLNLKKKNIVYWWDRILFLFLKSVIRSTLALVFFFYPLRYLNMATRFILDQNKSNLSGRPIQACSKNTDHIIKYWWKLSSMIEMDNSNVFV